MDSFGNSLEEQIANARTDTMNGKVVYDLTSGIDFSHPRKTAEALSKVLYEKDISKWFTGSGSDLKFSPAYRLEIRIQDIHNKAITRTIKDLELDIKYEELKVHYQAQIDSYVHDQLEEHSNKMIFASASLAVMQNFAEAQGLEEQYLKKLMVEVVGNITLTVT